AVGAYDWGSAEIYLIRVDDGRALRLTKKVRGKSMPAWNPDGMRIAVASGEKRDVGIVLLSGIQPYLGRLFDSREIDAFQRTADTRGPVPAAQ
ncbi:MAG TPA: hypothetical protein VFX92_06070, partial [Candidatus Krumholzibacteria bacterium]|nr:hypothetical protein [Candidatus Krumholzibacteria bacterium]